MKLLVTGASGFVGRNLVTTLTARGHEVVALSRSGEESGRKSVSGARGDVLTGEGLGEAMRGVSAVIHLVGIIREREGVSFERVHVEGTQRVLAAAREAGVKRYVHMSALGADERSKSAYGRTRARAEGLVRASDLKWTIFRPSLIFGPGDGFFGKTLKNLVTSYPLVVPQIGRGNFPFRPIWIGDVTEAFAQSLEKPDTTGRTFELVGPKEYRFAELLGLVKEVIGSKKPRFPVPVALMRLAVPLMQLLPEPPITRDELAMLLGGSTADPAPMQAAFELQWRTLEDELPRTLAAV